MGASPGIALTLETPAPAAGTAGNVVSVTVLQTTDLHGHLLAWDYPAAAEAGIGLARVATRIAAIRAMSPNVLLLDAGDTIQGTPIEYLHVRNHESGPDPMAVAMSLLRYDAMAVGNHEFNFGLGVLRKAQKESSFPWLSANTRNEADGSAAFPETLVKTFSGVRIGVLGLTTPAIPSWEPLANRPGLRWEDPVETAKRLVPVLRKKDRCDLVIVLIHSGPEVDLATGISDGTENENRIAAIARDVPGVDLILTGHTHRKIPLTRIAGVPVIQPGRWGEMLARVDLSFTRKGDRWALGDLKGELLPSDSSVFSDPAIMKIAEPLDRAARAYLAEKLAVAEDPFPAKRATLEDTALLDFVNDTQIEVTGADLSMTSLLPGSRFDGFAKGPLTVRDLYAFHPYENQLVVVEITGAILKSCLEHAAEFYGSAEWEGGRLLLRPKPGMIPYNFDVVQGASYRIDPTAPVGSRIKELTFRGRPVNPSDRFSLAVNAYRAQGAGGYSALKGAPVLKALPEEIRELLIAKARQLGKLVPRVDRNWIVAPDSAWSPAPASTK